MSKRRGHYKPSLLPGVFHRPTPRSELIKKLLREYRLMRTTHLNEFLKYYLEPASAQGTVKCLRWLFDTHEVIRIKNDPDSRMVTEGSLCKIHGLNTKANRSLNELPHRVSRVVPHTLEICNTVAFGIVRPIRESGGELRFIDAPDIVQSMGTAQAKAAAKPYTEYVRDACNFSLLGSVQQSSLSWTAKKYFEVV